MIENQRSRHSALPNALWDDRVTPKNSLGVSLYTLVYGKEAILPPNIMLLSSIIAQECRGTDNEILQIRIYNLLKVEESRSRAKERFKHQHEVVKRWFDKHKVGKNEFEVGDLVLKWDHSHDEKGETHKVSIVMGRPFFRLQQTWPLNLQIARFTGVGRELTG